MLEQATQFLNGLFQSDKRNIERMCENVKDSDYDRIQHFISVSPWDVEAVKNKVAQDTNRLFRSFNQIGLLIDESGHSKKGDKSVGVAWQYNGNKGKVENCQVGVYAALSAKNYYCIVDSQLYLPKEWTEDKERCLEAGIPENKIEFKTKPQIALEMIKSLRKQGIRFDWVDADGLYGNDSQFADALDEMGEIFVLEVHSDQHIYLEEPEIYIPDSTGKRRRKPTQNKSKQLPIQIRHYVTSMPQHYWKEVRVRDTSKGLLNSQGFVRKVWVWDKKSDKAKPRLLIVKKTQTKTGYELKYALTNAKEFQYTLSELIRMQSQRYFIERAFQEGKQELGMSEYQVRGWRAWHHHSAIVMMALEFVLREKLLNTESAPLLSTRDIRELLIKQLATKKRTVIDIIKQIFTRHKKRRESTEHFRQKNLLI